MGERGRVLYSTNLGCLHAQSMPVSQSTEINSLIDYPFFSLFVYLFFNHFPPFLHLSPGRGLSKWPGNLIQVCASVHTMSSTIRSTVSVYFAFSAKGTDLSRLYRYIYHAKGKRREKERKGAEKRACQEKTVAG